MDIRIKITNIDTFDELIHANLYKELKRLLEKYNFKIVSQSSSLDKEVNIMGMEQR